MNCYQAPILAILIKKSILYTFSTQCNFCGPENCPVDAVRIFGTRAAETSAIADQVETVRSTGVTITEVFSVDEVKTNASSNWKDVSYRFVFRLNIYCLEPRILYCYEGALLRLTVNIPNLTVSRSQMCVFQSFSTDKSMKVKVAPPGVRKLPPKDTFGNYFFENGWCDIVVNRQAGFVQSFKGSSLRRTQFPVKNFLAMTIQKAMGETIGKIVTKIDCFERAYSLGEKEQLYVLVSRVQHLKDLTFIGDKESTLLSLSQLLGRRTQWDDYMEQLVNTSCNRFF